MADFLDSISTYPFAQDYGVGNEYQFPPKDIDPALKNQKDYCIKCCKSIYSLFLLNKQALPYTIKPQAAMLRAFGKGTQPKNRYKSFLFGDETPNINDGSAPQTSYDVDASSWAQLREVRRKGWLNMDFEIISPIPKIKMALKGMIKDYAYDVVADNTDELSGAEKESAKWRAHLMMKDGEFINAFKGAAGMPQDANEFMPENIQELELFEAAGGFKLNFARVMEKLIHFSMIISNWDEIEDKVLDDLLDFGMAAVRTYYDPEDHLVKGRWVDTTRYLTQYSPTYSYHDSEYGAELAIWTISKLQQLGFDETELKTIAKKYEGILGNATFTTWDQTSMLTADGSRTYDKFRILVLESEWKDMDSVYETINIDKRGNRTIFGESFGKKRNTDRNKTRVTKLRRKYQCNWIVGTDMAFNFGLSVNQPHPTRLSFHTFEIPGQSITQRLSPVADLVQIGQLKLQNSLSQIFEAGYAIDFGMLNNITMGGNKVDVMKVLGFWKGTTILPYMANKIGHGYQGGAVTPITPIPSQFLTKVEEVQAIFNHAMSMIQLITGLNDATIAGIPVGEAPKIDPDVRMIAIQNVIRPLVNALYKLKSEAAQDMADMSLLAIRNDPKAYDEYCKKIGQTDVDLLKQSESDSRTYGIFLRERPTPTQKAAILKTAEISLGSHRDGRPGIDEAQYFAFMRMLDEGVSMKEIEMRLTYMIKKAYKEDQQNKLQAIQMQSQTQNNGIQMQINATREMEAAKAQYAKEIADNAARNDAALKYLDAYLKANPPVQLPMQGMPVNLMQQAGQMPQGDVPMQGGMGGQIPGEMPMQGQPGMQ